MNPTPENRLALPEQPDLLIGMGHAAELTQGEEGKGSEDKRREYS